MAKAVFITRVESIYDDLPEERYHFPKSYLKTAEKAVGDFVLYYESRRTTATTEKSGGRQSYYAIAIIEDIVPDPRRSDHYYALIKPKSYLDFVTPVPYKEGSFYFESILQKDDGSTNRGAFSRSVRTVPDEEFNLILSRGFNDIEIREEKIEAEEFEVREEPEIYDRPTIQQLVNLKYRNPAFRENIINAYEFTCAFTGLKLINGGGKCEIEASHIMPVAVNGPDSIRNGIALTRTAHWMFDRGIISMENDGKILCADKLATPGVKRLLRPEGFALLPSNLQEIPHRNYLEFHRENVFKG